MENTGKRAVGLVFVAALASILLGAMWQPGVSAQTQYVPKVHFGGPGSQKANLKQRYMWHVKPLHIIGNIYYVGTSMFGSWLITTPKGHFMIDYAVPDEVKESVEELGLKVTDVKYLLQLFAHNDHVLGLAQMKEWSHGQILAMPGDVPVLAEGGTSQNFLPDWVGPIYPPVKVDHVLKDGEKIELGGVTMVAHLTAGHTPGATSWTTVVEDHGKKYTVVFLGGCLTGFNQPLVGNKDYTNIAEDYANSYKTCESLHADIVLGIGGYNGLKEKVDRMAQNPGTNPFVDPQGYEELVAKNEKAFEAQLAKEKAGGDAYATIIRASAPCPKDGRTCYSVYDLLMKCCTKLGGHYVGPD